MGNCPLCCHETRNAMLAVTYYARQLLKLSPPIRNDLLVAAVNRLDRCISRCGIGSDGSEDIIGGQ